MLKSLTVFFGVIAFAFTFAVVLVMGYIVARTVAVFLKPRDADPPFDPELDEIDDAGPGVDVDDADAEPDCCPCDTCNARARR